MKRYIYDDQDSNYKNYKVVAYDDIYEDDVHYFDSYVEAIQYGNAHYNGQFEIEEI